MIATLLFSVMAAALVFLAGRSDKAHDPRLTVSVLVLLTVFPILLGLLPKIEILPTRETGGSAASFPWTDFLLFMWAIGFSVAAIRLGFAAKQISNWRKSSRFLE
jgi:hypothetical protein